MTFTVYCFNDAYQMSSILNGILHFIGSSSWTTITFTMLCVLFVISILKFERVDAFTYLRNMLTPFVLYLIFFATPCKLNIQDEFSGEVYTVSGIPFGVGAPLWVSSLAEKAFVDIIDQYVSPPQAPKFKEVDYFGHARMMAEVSTTNLWIDPPLQQTITEYFKNCVLHSIANGHLTPQDLKLSSNLLQSYQSTSNSLFTPVYTATGESIMTCSQAYQNISTVSPGKANQEPLKRAAQVFGARGKNGALAAASFNSILSSMFNGQQDNTESLFIQNLFINSTRAGLASISPDLQATMAEAEVRHFTSGVTAMMLYIKQLPKLRAIFKLVLVALFPLVGAFFLTASGRPFACWAGALLWISLWLPAQAAVHAAYVAETINDLRATTLATGGYSLASSASIVQWATETATLAGSIMMIVPVLSAMIIRWAFPYVGTTIAGMLQGARGLERQLAGASAGATVGARQTVLGLEKDEFARAAMDYGDANTAMRSHMKDMIGSYSNSLYQPTFGERPINSSVGEYMAQGSGDLTMSFNGSAHDISSAQASLTSAQREHDTMSRTLGAAAALQDMRTGGSGSSIQASHLVSESYRQEQSQLLSSTYDELEKQGYVNSHGKQAVEEATRAGVIGAQADLRLSAAARKGVALENATGILSQVGSVSGSLQGTGSLTGGYRETNTSKNSASEKHESSYQQGTGVSQSRSLGDSQVSSKSVQDAAQAFLSTTLSNSQNKSSSFTDSLERTQAAQMAYEAQKSRSELLSSSLGNAGSHQVNVKDVFGTLTDSGVGVLSDYNEAARSENHRSGHSGAAATAGYLDYVKSYSAAQKSGDLGEWKKVFSTIDGLENAHKLAGNERGVFGAQSMRQIAQAQYATALDAKADLSAARIGDTWQKDALLGRGAGVSEIDVTHAALASRAPGDKLPTSAPTVVGDREAFLIQHPKPAEMSVAQYENGVDSLGKEDPTFQERFNMLYARDSLDVAGKTRGETVRSESLIPQIKVGEYDQKAAMHDYQLRMREANVDAQIKHKDTVRETEYKAGVGRVKKLKDALIDK